MEGWITAVAFLLGALAFFTGDWLVDHRGGRDRKAIAGQQAEGSGAAIFIGTLLDNVPESIILGMSLLFGYLTHRRAGISLSTGLMGCVPGGFSQMVLMSEEIANTDVSVVSFMHTARLMSVIFICQDSVRIY